MTGHRGWARKYVKFHQASVGPTPPGRKGSIRRGGLCWFPDTFLARYVPIPTYIQIIKNQSLADICTKFAWVSRHNWQTMMTIAALAAASAPCPDFCAAAALNNFFGFWLLFPVDRSGLKNGRHGCLDAAG
ncbi:MAG: hypothetical protein WAR41_09600 [Azonexus sp.]